jgi:Ni/Co efflux regulator RcnB
MKKFLLGIAAAATVASPVLATAPASAADWHGRTEMHANRTIRHMPNRAAINHAGYRGPERVTYRQTYRPTYHAWNRGDRFDYRYAPNYRVIDDYRDYGLQAPPYGYRWEQSGNDAVLVALASGLIGAVIGGALN